MRRMCRPAPGSVSARPESIAGSANRADSIEDSVEARKKCLPRPEQKSRPGAACTTRPTGMLGNDNSFGCRVPILLRLAYTISHAAHGMNEFDREGLVHLSAQAAH